MGKIPGSAPLRAAIVVLACIAAVTHAQQKQGRLADVYPSRPVRLLVGNAPGGGIDLTARAVAQKLTERWGRSIVVDNRPGASGVIATDLTAKAAPDGHTLLVTSGSLLGSAMAQRKLPYDVRAAYAPITQLTSLYYLLLVNPSLPVNSVRDLIAYAKSKPGTLNYGSSGVGGAGLR